MPLPFTISSIALGAGVLYSLLALTVWPMLQRRHPRLPTRLWSTGSLAMGIGLVLVGERGEVPEWVTYQLANTVLQLSYVLRVMALRSSLGRPLHLRRSLGLLVVLGLIYQLCMQVPHVAARAVFGSLVLVVGNAVLGWHAWQVGLATPSRSGVILAWAEAAAATGMLLRMVWTVIGQSEILVLNYAWQFALLSALAAAAAVYSNLGYLGMVMDRVRALAQHARQERQTAVSVRDAAVLAADGLRTLLAQRDQLVLERDHLLQVLAHEIRQPVHNASGALLAAAAALQSSEAGANPQAVLPLLRAQAVLGSMQSVLDNALTGATLLTRNAPLLTQEVDLDFLIGLTLGDLPAAQRTRVQQAWQTTLRSAEMEPGLVRLALRNLLSNAFAHGGDAVQVRLQVHETRHPPALVLTVLDNGTGVSAQWLQDNADCSTGLPTGSRGLGLFIARRVMAMHDGGLSLLPNPPSGLSANLVFPLPGIDDNDPPEPGAAG